MADALAKHGHGPDPRHRAQPRRRRDQRQRAGGTTCWRTARRRYADYFDIAWRGSPRPELQDKVLLPVLGEPYGDVLESGGTDSCPRGRQVLGALLRPAIPDSSPESARGLDPSQLDRLNGTPGDPHSFDPLDLLLKPSTTAWRYWRSRVGRDQLPPVLRHQRPGRPEHGAAGRLRGDARFIVRADRQGKVAGLRIDHPTACTTRSSTSSALRSAARSAAATAIEPLYVVVEKILAPASRCRGLAGPRHQRLRLPEHGQRPVRRRPARSGAFTRLYQDWTGDPTEFEDLVYEKKQLILRLSLASELHMLTHQLDRLAQTNRRSPRLHAQRPAASPARGDRLLPRLPLLHHRRRRPRVRPRATSNSAVERAIARNPATEPAIFRFIRDTLLQRVRRSIDEDRAATSGRFAGKFQQVTAPVTAKGIEDTAFYIYNRLVSLNEVGGEPAHFGVAPGRAPRLPAEPAGATGRTRCRRSRRTTPSGARTCGPGSTCCRRCPDEWRQRVARWGELNAASPQAAGRPPAPRPQRGVPALPDAGRRLAARSGVGGRGVRRSASRQYMVKAMREAKVHTSWTNPNAEYEAAVTAIRRPHPRRSARPFLDDFLRSSVASATAGCSTRSRQTLLSSPRPACRTRTRGRNCGTSAWSTRTTAGRWITKSAAARSRS